ncbi:uncharacterized protein LOC115440686 [Manduca sexta]|uniref:Spaetzle domain-containing protein n=1 Tax=Manduca sexta TaxID=7130 RepID=A0A922CH06_MANSE|nr:uncharacterized protein LOC115440686 [Manduca sexta]KAG6445806.1 hypothetical protein O3G_MSEX004107 [Manduca sexta]
MSRLIFTFVGTFAIFQSTSHYVAADPSKVEMPEQCAGMNFCVHKHEDYPDEAIENLLKDSKKMYEEYPEDFVLRIGPEQDQMAEDECASTSHVDPIYEIVDIHGNIRFVVQSERFKQIIRIEQCEQPGRLMSGTRNINGELLDIVHLECKQCTMNYKFTVLGLDRKSLEAVDVQGGLPVCCSCRTQ